MQLTLERNKLGEFNCAIVKTPAAQTETRQVVILCHGFGASGEDLLPCAQEIISMAREKMDGVQFIFPAAPIQLDNGFGDSRAWWPIDMEALQMAMQTGQLRDLRNDEPPLLSARRTSMLELIEWLKQEIRIDESQIILGGFSQGSMVATDVALSMERAPGGLIIWSGTLLSESRWKELADGRGPERRFPVLQTHGTLDPILPFAAAEWLRDLLMGSGFSVTFHSFAGPHTIPPQGIELAAELILGQ